MTETPAIRPFANPNPTRRTLLAGGGALLGAAALSACSTVDNTRAGDEGTILPKSEEKKEGPTQISEMIGKPCRVIRPGDAVTRDYRPERVNIFVDAGNRIERITYG
ncbi:I78 family peptidase inhibitor [Falsiroseomonas sp.]|uniref:I78 family peptidase inhibitor n=1 Tax=Falsiroseomonas sp. TaxID=2870721 RepID=UPI00272464CD|nr:I78 family peptidase inhibitor [Falsiroseomonas sp.]MDO9503644.1 I78 family peptidase inhibitor [Falsiroseomonas sp.]